jgi:hypothetical protein
VALVKVTDRPGGTGRKEKSKDMKATHTPGPWTPRSRSMSDGSLIVAGDHQSQYREVACLRDRAERVRGPQNDEDIANAVLIAAAPELLAALQEIADRGPVDGYTSAGALRLRLAGSQTIARAAIAKATA